MDSHSYSFIIPAYNDAHGLQRHIEYFKRRREDIQLIIVDDCSADDTATVVANAQCPENIEIAYHRMETNSGPGIARNTGLQLAEGDFVMFLDADDMLSDCFFRYIEMSPLMAGADFVMFKYHLAENAGERFTYNMHESDNKFFSQIHRSGFPAGLFSLDDLPGALKTTNYPWNKIYTRDFIKTSGIYFPDMRMHEDILPHWHGFLAATYFGILNWAPPLITHFEERSANRATNYIGQERLKVFAMLKQIYEEVAAHHASEILIPEFTDFAQGLFNWMINGLCAASDVETRTWRKKYKRAIDEFWHEIGDPNRKNATEDASH